MLLAGGLQRCQGGLAGARVAARAAGGAAGPGSQAGRVFLVTGSTDGIGRHTAARLAEAGATVLVHGRSAERVERAVDYVRERAVAGARVKGYVADLSSLQQVRRLAEDVGRDHPRLWALVNNAGVYEPRKQLSADGFEMTWAVNVLAPFLLTSLLWRRVDDQIVTTASISAASHIDMDNLQQQRGYSAHDAYSLSKLCDIVLTLRLDRLLRAQGSAVRANTLDPGTVNTKMLLAGWGRIGIEVQSAENTLRLLEAGGAGEGPSGAYFVGGRQSRPPRVAEDERVQEQLWSLWEQQTGASWS